MDTDYDKLHSQVFALDRNGSADVLDYLCISIVDKGWRYRVRGKAHEDIILATLALDLRSRIKLRDEMMNDRDPEIEAAWIEECKRRLDAYDRGEMGSVSAEESIANARWMIQQAKERMERKDGHSHDMN